VAQHHVGRAGLDVRLEVGNVTLDPGDQVGDAGLVGAPVEGRERVGTRVDDGDRVALPGQPDGEAAGAAADVDDPGTLLVEGRRVLQPALDGVPDDAGAHQLTTGAAALAGRHGAQPRGVVAPFILGSRGCGATACERRP
jgi:hypothetical protein